MHRPPSPCRWPFRPGPHEARRGAPRGRRARAAFSSEPLAAQERREEGWREGPEGGRQPRGEEPAADAEIAHPLRRLAVGALDDELQILLDRPLAAAREGPAARALVGGAAAAPIVERRSEGEVAAQDPDQARREPVVPLDETALVPDRLVVAGRVRVPTREPLRHDARLAPVERQVRADADDLVDRALRERVGAVVEEEARGVKAEGLGGAEEEVLRRVVVFAVVGAPDRAAREREASRRVEPGE